MVVNNDGLHSPEQKEAQIALKAGFHQITVTMFERDGGEELDVLYAGPGISQRQIPKDVLFTACPAQSAPASGSPDGKKTEGMAEQK
jgi:hypothetical protein